MPKTKRPNPKLQALKESGTLHRRPDAIADEHFRENDFFDPRDLLQVKYEMLRRVDVDGDSVSAAAKAFGFSRPAFYEGQRAFRRGGLAALVRQRPGPRTAHKLSRAVMDFAEKEVAANPSVQTDELLRSIEKEFDIHVHRRSLERARARREKRRRGPRRASGPLARAVGADRGSVRRAPRASARRAGAHLPRPPVVAARGHGRVAAHAACRSHGRHRTALLGFRSPTLNTEGNPERSDERARHHDAPLLAGGEDMSTEENRKVTTSHLSRNAYLYVRQSTLRQVLENTESTHRQYALRERAVALGWSSDRIIVIDTDLGQSGASAADREGFQRLVTEVGMGRAGIVLGLEVSRLARNSTDWHRLLEICALAGTLILDEDGVYDPGHFNDRLLLGLKGTMSEAELHVLRARLRGGILNKARRGELQWRLPVGFAYDTQGRVVLDPDVRVQQSVRLLFDTFERTGSAWATVKAFRQQEIAFPRHMIHGRRGAEIVWRPLDHYLVLHVLHNPRYAGAFVFGRHRTRKLPDGRATYETLPQDQWAVCLKGSHPGYVTWEQFEANQRRLRELRQARAEERANSVPREGNALVQGIVICGRCGQRMTIRYNESRGALSPRYICAIETVKQGLPVCQNIPGASIDAAVGALVLEAISPLTLDTALAVHDELQARLDQADRLRRQHVERRRYEAEIARRRFLQVDPDNRLVASSLEADWNDKLRDLRGAEEEYERHQRLDRAVLSAEQREGI